MLELRQEPLTQKVPKMTLNVTAGGENLTFESPIAEGFLSRIKSLTVGEELLEWFDKDSGKHKGVTFCCGDKYDYTVTVEEKTYVCPELDCCGFPILYEGDK